MDEFDMIARLAEAARKESPPAVDVAEKVMWRLTGLRVPFPRFWPLAAAISAATAAAFLLALQAWVAWQDPVVELLNSVRMVLR